MTKKDEEAAPAVVEEAAPALSAALVQDVIAGCRDIANDPRTPEDTVIQLNAWANRFEEGLSAL